MQQLYMLSGSNSNQVIKLYFNFKHINLKSIVIKQIQAWVYFYSIKLLGLFVTVGTYRNAHIRNLILC